MWQRYKGCNKLLALLGREKGERGVSLLSRGCSDGHVALSLGGALDTSIESLETIFKARSSTEAVFARARFSEISKLKRKKSIELR
jgi:hypothetical protein